MITILTQDKKNKMVLVDSIQKRNTKLNEIYLENYDKYLWLCDELKITHQPVYM